MLKDHHWVLPNRWIRISRSKSNSLIFDNRHCHFDTQLKLSEGAISRCLVALRLSCNVGVVALLADTRIDYEDNFFFCNCFVWYVVTGYSYQRDYMCWLPQLPSASSHCVGALLPGWRSPNCCDFVHVFFLFPLILYPRMSRQHASDIRRIMSRYLLSYVRSHCWQLILKYMI